MKKSTLKKVVATALCATLTLSLAACGGKKGENGGNNAAGGNSLDPAVSMQNAKQGVFKSVPVSIMDELKDYSFQYLTMRNGKLYSIANKYTWIETDPGENVEDGENTEDGNTIGHKIAGTTIIETEDGVVDEYIPGDEDYYYEENGYSVSEYVLFTANADGSSQTFTKLDMTMEGDVDPWFANGTFDKDGKAYGLLNFGYDDTENEAWYEVFNLVSWNADGTQAFNNEIFKFNNNDTYSYCMAMGTDDKGQIVLIMQQDDTPIVYLYDQTGKVIAQNKISADGLSYVERSFVYNDKVYTTGYDEEYTHYCLYEFEIATGKELQKCELPTNFNGCNSIECVGDGIIIGVSEKGIYKYKIGDEKATKLMDYVNSDMSSVYFDSYVYVDDQNFFAMYYDYTTDSGKEIFEKFTYVDPKDIPDKTALTFGCIFSMDSIRNEIIKFNKNSDKYRITIKDYYEEAGDWEAAVTALNNDITAGKMPDIIASDGNVNLVTYANKGVFVDLKKLIADDAELSKNEYISNVFDMYTLDGKMYALPYCFGVQTFVAKASLVGNPEKFTFEDALNVLKTMPDGATLFGDTTRDSFIYDALSFGGDTFVDYNKGECHFDSQDFIDVLEYAKTLPKQYDEDYWNDYDYTSYQSQYRENRALLASLYFGNISECKYTIKGLMGEKVAFVGFPTENGQGSVLSSYGTPFAISAKSNCIDGAWEFIRSFITADYQNSASDSNNMNSFYGFPVLKSAFEAQAKKATERPYWVDEDGNKQEYDDMFYINGEDVVLEPFSDAEVKEICDFVYSINGSYYYDEKISKIIEEETAPFFAGQKQAKETAAIIQNRVQLMIDESR